MVSITASFAFVAATFGVAYGYTEAEAQAALAEAAALSEGEYYRPPTYLTSGDVNSTTPFRRSPCPAMNTLANHGYLPRDGKNITVDQAVAVVMDKFNIAQDLAAVMGGLSPDLFDLNDLSKHNDKVEHDASLARSDSYFGEDPSLITPSLINDVLNYGLDGSVDVTDVATIRAARVAWGEEHNPQFDFSATPAFIAGAESALLLRGFGGDNGNSTATTFVATFFLQEMFPEGWTKPDTEITYADALATISYLDAVNVYKRRCQRQLYFTAEKSEFSDLNAALGLVEIANIVEIANMVGSLFGKYDPLVLRNVPLTNFNYSILGQKLTITPTVETVTIIGLTSVVPQHVNANSSNSVEIAAESEKQVSVDVKLSVTAKELGASAKAHLIFGMNKPTLATNIQADMFACAPDISSSLCSNMTVAGLQVEAVNSAIFGGYDSIVKEVLMKFKDASVQSFELDFASVSKFKIKFDSSNFVFSTIANLLTGYSADEINEKGAVYNTLIWAINHHAPALLNKVIDSKLKPWFGATCLSKDER